MNMITNFTRLLGVAIACLALAGVAQAGLVVNRDLGAGDGIGLGNPQAVAFDLGAAALSDATITVLGISPNTDSGASVLFSLSRTLDDLLTSSTTHSAEFNLDPNDRSYSWHIGPLLGGTWYLGVTACDGGGCGLNFIGDAQWLYGASTGWTGIVAGSDRVLLWDPETETSYWDTPGNAGYALDNTGAFQVSNADAVPEPATCALIGVGLMAVGFIRRRVS